MAGEPTILQEYPLAYRGGVKGGAIAPSLGNTSPPVGEIIGRNLEKDMFCFWERESCQEFPPFNFLVFSSFYYNFTQSPVLSEQLNSKVTKNHQFTPLLKLYTYVYYVVTIWYTDS